MEEYQQYLSLVHAVVSGDSPANVRREAEVNLSNIHNNREMWQHLLHFLSLAVSADANGSTDNVLFFIGMCLCVCISVCVSVCAVASCSQQPKFYNRHICCDIYYLSLMTCMRTSQDKVYIYSYGVIGVLSYPMSSKLSSPPRSSPCSPHSATGCPCLPHPSWSRCWRVFVVYRALLATPWRLWLSMVSGGFTARKSGQGGDGRAG